MKLKLKEKKKKKGTNQNIQRIEKRRRKEENVQIKLIDIECESIRIKSQKHNEMLQCISSGVPIPIKSSALMQYMSPRLNRIVVTWTREVYVREES